MTRIEFERRRLGWNQSQLAEAAGLTQPIVSKIERRELPPRPEHVEQLSRVLGIPRDALLYMNWAEALVSDDQVALAG